MDLIKVSKTQAHLYTLLIITESKCKTQIRWRPTPLYHDMQRTLRSRKSRSPISSPEGD